MRRKVKGEVRHELWVKITLFKSGCTELSSLEAKGAVWSGCRWGVCTASGCALMWPSNSNVHMKNGEGRDCSNALLESTLTVVCFVPSSKGKASKIHFEKNIKKLDLAHILVAKET